MSRANYPSLSRQEASVDVPRISEGPAAAYYGMMAQKALDGSDEQ